jgi:RNA recognition motif-containing protein
MEDRTLFLSNLHPEVTEADLEKVFSPFGNLASVELLRAEGITAYNKGRCFLYFETPEAAQTACTSVNGRQVLKGKLLKASLGVRGAIQEKVNKVIRGDANKKADEVGE